MVGSQVGAYRLLSPLGKGGFGEVWLGEHVMLGRKAAIKLLNANVSSDPTVVARFFNEAKAATAISDPGIVQVFDFGHQPDGSAYIVMELLEGETLDRRLRERGLLPIVDALRLVQQVATSLGAAHAHGIVHRDLKPENIFVVRDPAVAGGERAKILDFGIAKLSPEWSGVQTHSAALLGTPAYMSPEQCRGAGQVDLRSDIYSAGCVLFHLITGRLVFAAAGLGELISQHISVAPPRLATLVSAIPPAVDALVARCLAKDPADRYASGAELASAIGELLARPDVLAFASRATAGTRPGDHRGHVTTLGAASGSRQSPRSSRRAVFVAVGALAVATAGIAIAVTRDSADHVAPAATPPPPVAPLPDASDLRHAATAQLGSVLLGFLTWAANHPGCPTPADLAPFVDGGLVDPWGHPIAITCTDQPSDQIIGAIALGPDGVRGTADDLQSWRLDPEITRRIHGERRGSAAPPPIAVVTDSPRIAKPKQPTPTPHVVEPKASASAVERGDQENTRGKNLMFSGKFAEAAEAFKTAIAFAPTNAKFLFNACTAHYQLGEFAAARTLCLRAKSSNPTPLVDAKISKLLARIAQEQTSKK